MLLKLKLICYLSKNTIFSISIHLNVVKYVLNLQLHKAIFVLNKFLDKNSISSGFEVQLT